MSLEEKISELNYKYQFVQNNKYWNYNQVYDLNINDKVYQISENDILLNISHNIAKNINGSFNNKKYMSDYEIPNIDIEQMKKIVIDFYMQVNPELSNKIAFILSKTDFIKYDENIPSNLQRSVTTSEGIKLYYKNDLNSLVTLAHELSHGISNLGDDLRLKDSKGVESLSEVESMLTEELFLDYLKNINLQIKEKESINEVRTLDDNIINDIKYYKYKGVIHTAYRAIDELEIKKVLESNKIDNIDEDFIDKLSNSMNTSKEEMIKKIDMFVSRYYPNDNQIHDYIGVVDYDLRNGQQLSNEARFIYANCLVEKLNGMNLDNQQKIEFYKMYLNNAKNMSFQEVLKLFNVDLTNPYSFSEEFISEFKNHPVLFVGTGLSLRYLKHSYTWDGLLEHISYELTGNDEYSSSFASVNLMVLSAASLNVTVIFCQSFLSAHTR